MEPGSPKSASINVTQPDSANGLNVCWFLTQPEKQRLSEWDQKPNDDSVTAYILRPITDLT